MWIGLGILRYINRFVRSSKIGFNWICIVLRRIWFYELVICVGKGGLKGVSLYLNLSCKKSSKDRN